MCNQGKHDHDQSIGETVLSTEQECQEPVAVCCSQMAHVQDKLGECTAQLAKQEKIAQEWQHKCMLTMADFENFKRRSTKEMEAIGAHKQARVLADLLTIADDFDRALQTTSNKSQGDFEGFVIIRKSLDKILANYGVTHMNNYESFNPEFHEALAQVDADDSYHSGDIVEVLQKGYLFNGSVLRHAKVSVAK